MMDLGIASEATMILPADHHSRDELHPRFKISFELRSIKVNEIDLVSTPYDGCGNSTSVITDSAYTGNRTLGGMLLPDLFR
jgi:hypothetical protein